MQKLIINSILALEKMDAESRGKFVSQIFIWVKIQKKYFISIFNEMLFGYFTIPSGEKYMNTPIINKITINESTTSEVDQLVRDVTRSSATVVE
jgi:hypothetical protein